MLKIKPLKNCLNSRLAHSIKANNKLLKKGLVLKKQDIFNLKKDGVKELYVFQESKTDINEDMASNRIAKFLSGRNIYCAKPVNGRADLFSTINGMIDFNCKLLASLNYYNADVAISMIKNEKIVKKNQLVGNIKILPFAINRKKILKITNNSKYLNLISVKEKTIRKVALIISTSEKNNKIEKIILKSLNFRLNSFDMKINNILFNKHSIDALKINIANLIKNKHDLILIYGSTSIVDKNDIIPRSIRSAEGKVISFGAPTDPGNLLMLGNIKNTNIIGVPGCAKSISRNGFDIVLEKICFGKKVSKYTLAEMSNGGLFKSLIKKEY